MINALLNPASKLYLPIRWALLIGLGLSIYYQTFFFGFVFDDNRFIVDNPFIRNFNSIHAIWETFPKTRLIGIYSFALNYHFNQLNPQGYHIFNFIIHLIATTLVWGLAKLLFKITNSLENKSLLRQELPFIIALLFLVHPGQTQAITYISQRFESIAALFYLGSIYCYLQARISNQEFNKYFFWFLSFSFVFLGLFTKETVVTIPLMIIAFELILWPKEFVKLLNYKKQIGLLLIGVLLCLLSLMKLLRTDLYSFFTVSTPSESHYGDVITFDKYILTQMRVLLTFIRLLILPINQNLDYDYPLSTGILTPNSTLIGISLISFLFFLIISFKKKLPLLAIGLTWILITFSINFAPRANIIFEHKLYLISFGFFLSLVFILFTIIKNQRLLGVILTGLIAILSLLSYQRNHVWKNELTLWEDVVVKSPNKQRGYANLGRAYILNQQSDKAIPLLDKAIELKPTDYLSYINRGFALNILGQHDLALTDLKKSILIEPRSCSAHLVISTLYKKRGDFTKALEELNTSIKLNPSYMEAYLFRAKLFVEMKLFDKAIEDYKIYLQHNPDDLATFLEYKNAQQAK